jgi:hypothetical protein
VGIANTDSDATVVSPASLVAGQSGSVAILATDFYGRPYVGALDVSSSNTSVFSPSASSVETGADGHAVCTGVVGSIGHATVTARDTRGGPPANNNANAVSGDKAMFDSIWDSKSPDFTVMDSRPWSTTGTIFQDAGTYAHNFIAAWPFFKAQHFDVPAVTRPSLYTATNPKYSDDNGTVVPVGQHHLAFPVIVMIWLINDTSSPVSVQIVETETNTLNGVAHIVKSAVVEKPDKNTSWYIAPLKTPHNGYNKMLVYVDAPSAVADTGDVFSNVVDDRINIQDANGNTIATHGFTATVTIDRVGHATSSLGNSAGPVPNP